MPGDTLLVRARVASDDADRPRLDVDLAFEVGITAVMGPSGAGKSTLLASIAGLVTPQVGRIELGGTVLFDSASGTSVPTHLRRVSLVFQSLALFPHLNGWQNVAFGLREPNRSSRRKRALEWLERTRVGHLADRMPSTMSGGEAQRVAMARACASEPGALLLDEPLSALDDTLRRQVGEELRELVEEMRIPSVFVTHRAEDAERLGTRVLALEGGRIVESH